jgi:hypothetical protein
VWPTIWKWLHSHEPRAVTYSSVYGVGYILFTLCIRRFNFVPGNSCALFFGETLKLNMISLGRRILSSKKSAKLGENYSSVKNHKNLRAQVTRHNAMQSETPQTWDRGFETSSEHGGHPRRLRWVMSSGIPISLTGFLLLVLTRISNSLRIVTKDRTELSQRRNFSGSAIVWPPSKESYSAS